MHVENHPSALRYELKMDCEQVFLPQVKSWVQLHPVGFRQAFPDRWVNSLYMDTPDLDTLNDHLEGVPVRRKFRYRWYGENLGDACGQFEIKNKNERVGWKLIQSVEIQFDLRSQRWMVVHQKMIEYLSQVKNNLFLEILKVSRPLVIISYLRKYYISGDGQVRLTIDCQQKAFDQWMSVYPNLLFRLPSSDNLTIEIKSEVSEARNLADILASFPLRTHRHSKFVTAVSTLLER